MLLEKNLISLWNITKANTILFLRNLVSSFLINQHLRDPDTDLSI